MTRHTTLKRTAMQHKGFSFMTWPKVKLKEAIGTGLFKDGDWVESKDQDPNGDVRLLQLADIGINNFVDKSSRFMNSQTAKRLRCTFLETGDILIARMPDPIGRACLFPGDKKQCATVVDVCIARPQTNKTNSRYLVHFLNSPPFFNNVEKFVKGATRQRISRTNLESLEIPLPPLAEQKRLASILDRADELRRTRRHTLRVLDELAQSLFLELFGDPATNPKGWEVVRLGDVNDIISGSTPKTGVEAFWNGNIFWATPKDLSGLNSIHLSSTEKRITEAGKLSCSTRLLPIGSVLFSSRAPIGHVAINTMPVCTNQGFKSFITKAEKIHNLYLFFWLRLRRDYLDSLGNGATFREISKATVEKIEIPLPPLSLQQKFAQQIEELEAIKSRARASLLELDALFACLQSRAFAGELSALEA